ncbi:MAG: aromatic ring-hydroxylating dioxygenase subunit alpha [Rhodovibrionaceae bacterium]
MSSAQPISRKNKHIQSSEDDALERTRRPLDRARHAPGYIYSSPEVFALEKERIFMKDWLLVARSEDLKKPGNYMTFRVMGEPVLLVRNEDGKVNALSNTCAHRGVEVASGCGKAKLFHCPYHGWLYDLNGQLKRAQYMETVKNFDFENCRLPSLRCEEWGGSIFICFSEDTPPLDVFLKDLIDEYSFLHPELCEARKKIVIQFDCNWKLVVENKIDIYHVNTLHAKTLGAQTDFSKTGFDGENGKLTSNGGVSMRYPGTTGIPSRKEIFPLMPWMEDIGSEYGSHMRHSPNLHFVGRADGIRLSSVWPLDVDKTEAWFWYLFPKEWKGDPDYDEKCQLYEDFLVSILTEDSEMIASLQKATATRSLRPGPMSRLETGIHHVLNDYLDRMFGERG